MSVETEDLLNPDLEFINSSTGILSRLWRLTLWKLQLSYPKWESNVGNYVAIMERIYGVKRAQNIKGNLDDALKADDMTWANFVKGMVILNRPITKLTFRAVKGEVELERTIVIKTVATCTRANEVFELEHMEESRINLKNVLNDIFDTYIGNEEDWQNALVKYSEQKSKVSVEREGEERSASAVRSSIKKKLKTPTIMWKSFVEGLEICELDYIELTLVLGGTRCLQLNLRANL